MMTFRHLTAATLGALLLAGTALAQSEGAAWLKKIDAAEEIEHSYGVMEQTITTSTGRERTLTMKAWSTDGGDKQLMVYTAPARVEGDKILTLEGGDHIWYYMQRRDVTRHFTGHTRKQSAMGSDFAYQDLAQGDMTEDYSAEYLGDEEVDDVACVKLKCTPTESGPTYDHIVLWAGMEDHLTRRIDYYDEDGFLKRLVIRDFEQVDGRTVGMFMKMTNEREGSHTTIVTKEMDLEQPPDPSLFTKAALSRSIR